MAYKGSTELQQKLAAIAANMNVAMVKSVDRNTRIIQASAKLLCPVDIGELRNSIFTTTKQTAEAIQGVVYTNKEYAPCIELGTGPVGAADHEGISPEITPSYRTTGWVHHTENGFIYTNGQPARPFLYPALKDNEEQVKARIAADMAAEMEKYSCKT